MSSMISRVSPVNAPAPVRRASAAVPRLGSARDPHTGQYAPAASDSTVQRVILPNGRVGYRVGSAGRIYADPGVAKREALRASEIETARYRFLCESAGYEWATA